MMTFTRIVTALTGLISCLVLANSMPISTEDYEHSDDAISIITGLSGCFCGFYDKTEIDLFSTDSNPVVNFLADYARCNFEGFVSCKDKCKNLTLLEIEKLCKEGTHRITKPGYIFFKFCDETKWINTGVMIGEEELACCHNRSLNCSQMYIRDRMANIVHQLYSKAFLFQSDGTNASNVPVFEAENSTNDRAINFAEFEPLEFGSGNSAGTEETNEAYTEEAFFRSDNFDWNLNSSLERDSDREAQVPRTVKNTTANGSSLGNKTEINNLNSNADRNAIYNITTVTTESTKDTQQSATEVATNVVVEMPCSCSKKN